jgi:N-acetylmuramoyl-L-alanine amidase
MAVRDPYSQWMPFDDKSTTPLAHDIICVHTMVGTLAGSWAWANQAGNPYWHYGVNGRGAAWQCQDLSFRSAANLNGNWHVIPIETSDIKEGVFADTWQDPPWTDAQVDMLVKLIAWLCVRFNIPPVLIPDTKPGRRGLAYHRQGINPTRVSDGELWSKSFGKACPAARIHQFINVVIPRVQRLVAGEGVDDSMSAADVAALKQYMNEQFTQVDKSIAEIDDRTRRHLILDRDQFLDPEEHEAGRANAKTLVQGALLDGLRKSEVAGDDRGGLREPFKELLKEALHELAEELPADEPVPTEGGT